MVKKLLNLKLHQKIFVMREFDDTKYNSTIEDFNDNTIYISLPLAQQVPLVLHRGNKVTIQLISPDHLLEFECTVTSLVQDNIVLIGLSYPTDIKRIQLRKFVRLDILMKVKYALKPEPDKQPEYKTADALNISAGGMKFAAREHIEHGKEILLQFTLPINKKDIKYDINCLVRRSALMEIRGKVNLYHVGVEFKDITARERDQIVQYIFQQASRTKKS